MSISSCSFKHEYQNNLSQMPLLWIKRVANLSVFEYSYSATYAIFSKWLHTTLSDLVSFYLDHVFWTVDLKHNIFTTRKPTCTCGCWSKKYLIRNKFILVIIWRKLPPWEIKVTVLQARPELCNAGSKHPISL